jgi:hypothetical protein
MACIIGSLQKTWLKHCVRAHDVAMDLTPVAVTSEEVFAILLVPVFDIPSDDGPLQLRIPRPEGLATARV